MNVSIFKLKYEIVLYYITPTVAGIIFASTWLSTEVQSNRGDGETAKICS